MANLYDSVSNYFSKFYNFVLLLVGSYLKWNSSVFTSILILESSLNSNKWPLKSLAKLTSISFPDFYLGFFVNYIY